MVFFSSRPTKGATKIWKKLLRIIETLVQPIIEGNHVSHAGLFGLFFFLFIFIFLMPDTCGLFFNMDNYKVKRT